MTRLLSALLLTCVTVLAALRPASTAAETWVMGAMEDFAPFNYMDNGTFTGIDVQIMDEAAALIGVTLDHHPVPWKRMLLDFEGGKFDGVFQLTPTTARFEKWHLAGPLRTTRSVYVTRADSPLQDIRSPADLEGLVVGLVAGFTYEESFDSDPAIRREMSQDDFNNIRKLLLGRSDVIVGGYATLAYTARQLNAWDKLRVLPSPMVELGRFAAFPRTPEGAEKAQRLQQALDQMQANGRIQEIMRTALNR